MARRKSYSKLDKSNRINATLAKGKGDVLYKGFQCLNPHCDNFIYVPKSDVKDGFEFICSKCGYKHVDGEALKCFDYSMHVYTNEEKEELVSSEDGEFLISHWDYLMEASEYKYCVLCNALKPISLFDVHSSRKSNHQSECRLCKGIYNAIKNPTRLSEQHFESSQGRRLRIEIVGNFKVRRPEIERRFNHRCFCCGKDLSNITDNKEKPLDHTLPIYYLWPISTENATLLCHECNGNKSGKWPSDFEGYSQKKLHELAVLTGIDYKILAGRPIYNPQALDVLHDAERVDAMLTKYAKYMDEIIRLRNRIYKDIGFDFFSVSTKISQRYIKEADDKLQN